MESNFILEGSWWYQLHKRLSGLQSHYDVIVKREGPAEKGAASFS
jgi:hypothetical protein